MAANWPPAPGTYPAWPPDEMTSASSLREMLTWLKKRGYTHAAPTSQEVTLYFSNTVRCGDNHQVTGRMLVSPDGTRRWPFAGCNNAQHRQGLVLWWPYELTKGSGDITGL
jgi:hypothetical protein